MIANYSCAHAQRTYSLWSATVAKCSISFTFNDITSAWKAAEEEEGGEGKNHHELMKRESERVIYF